MSTIDQALAGARARLARTSDSAGLDAELLLAQVLGLPRAALLARGSSPLQPAVMDAYEALLRRRERGEPVAYLIGRRGFWSLELEVNPDVLVPRPETEGLVELGLARISAMESPRILDLGTGSGAIALALAHERPDAVVDAVDASAAALAVARHNAARLGVGNVQFLQGSWFTPVAGRRYHLVVANPPYLAATDPHLPALSHEPHDALVAGATGLESIEVILGTAADHLQPGAWLLIEHGAGQGQAVRTAFGDAGFEPASTWRDLAGLERVTGARRPPTA